MNRQERELLDEMKRLHEDKEWIKKIDAEIAEYKLKYGDVIWLKMYIDHALLLSEKEQLEQIQKGKR